MHIDQFSALIDALESIARSLDTIANPVLPHVPESREQLRKEWLEEHEVLQKGAVREPLDPSILAAGGVVVAPDDPVLQGGPEEVDWGGGKVRYGPANTPDDLEDVNTDG